MGDFNIPSRKNATFKAITDRYAHPLLGRTNHRHVLR